MRDWLDGSVVGKGEGMGGRVRVEFVDDEVSVGGYFVLFFF